MTFDKIIAMKAGEAVKDSSPTRMAYVHNLVYEWETACYLSRGGDPSRSQHWEEVARDLRRTIATIARVQGPRETVGAK